MRRRTIVFAAALLAIAGGAAFLAIGRGGPGAEDSTRDALPPVSPGLTAPRASEAPGTVVVPPEAAKPPAKNALRGEVVDAGGTVVPRARVVAIPLASALRGDGLAPVRLLGATADEGGRFAFEDLEAGAYGVSASAAVGVGALPLVRVAAEGDTTVRVRLAASVAIEGRVTDEAGAPIAGARVVVDGSAPLRALYHGLYEEGMKGRADVESVAGDDGRFRLAPLAEGPYDLDVSAPGRVPRSVRAVRAPATDVVVVLRAAGRVTGTVALGNAPLPPEVRVWTEPKGGDVKVPATQDREVAFALEGLVPGAYRVLATARGFEQATADVRVGAGADAGPLRLALAGGTPVSGFVRAKETGAPIVDAEVALGYVTRVAHGSSRHLEETLRTDVNGAWAARLRPGEWTAAASKEGWAPPEGGDVEDDTFAVGADPVERVHLLVASPAVVGVVVYPDGAPVDGATVSVTSATHNPKRADGGAIGVGSSMTDETGEDGRFRIEGVVTYAQYAVTAVGPGGARATVEEVVFEEGKDVAEAQITIERAKETGGRVEGRIVDEGGAPVAGAVATFAGRSVVAGPDGAFVREGVPTGTHRPRFGAVGYALGFGDPFAVRDGATVRLPDWVLRRFATRVVGHVTSSSGKPIEGAGVLCWFWVTEREPFTVSTATRADGRYVQEGPDLRGRPVTVQVRADGYQMGEKRLDLLPETVADFVLEGYAAVTAVLSFSGAAPARVEAAYIHDEFKSWWPADVTWDADRGSLRLGRVDPGRRRFKIAAPGYAPVLPSEIEVREGEAASLGSLRMTPGGTASGRLLGADGKPVAGVQVSLSDLFLYVDTDSEGRWRIEHVPAGTWEFHVNGLEGREGPSPRFALAVEEGKTAETEFRVP